MPLIQIQQLAAPDMAAVDAVIREQLQSEVVLVSQVSEYIIGGGGKRLRPLLHTLAARAVGYDGQHHHTLAAVVEFIHTATLLHDDVVDASELRRGRKTANQLFGNAAAVLVGDFVYSRAFQMMVGINSMRVMQVLADATNVIAEGEVLQLMNCRDPGVDEQRYLQVIRYKTARLFEAATRLAAILAGMPPAIEDALARYGAHLGTAFQVIDDVLDYSGQLADTGKNLGDDLAEGKVTLPLIEVMRVGTPAQAALVRAAIIGEDGGPAADLAAVVAAIEATGALDYSRECARRESEAARACLVPLPASPYREALATLTEIALTRIS
jgi:octaprenyl-diphosphate synthase